MIYDLAIIGGGPAGVAAGIYASRKKIRTILITDSFGGQSIVSAGIENWVGVKSISGFDLAKNLEEHLRAQPNIEILEGDLVSEIKKNGSGFELKTKSGKLLETKTVLMATGSSRRKLNVPGERELDGRGMVYCSTCDAPIFKDMVVAVVGGGNAGLEAVVDLLPYAKKIYLLEYGEFLKGDALTQEKIISEEKAEVVLNAETKKILGSQNVEGLVYLDKKSGKEKTLAVQGVFVEIGLVPASVLVKDLVALNKFGEIVVDPKTQAASLSGIWAAGDVSDALYKQNNISAGDGIKAVLNICDYLQKAK